MAPSSSLSPIVRDAVVVVVVFLEIYIYINVIFIFIFYILYFIFYILYFIFYILYFIFHILYFIFYILYFICYISDAYEMSPDSWRRDSSGILFRRRFGTAGHPCGGCIRRCHSAGKHCRLIRPHCGATWQRRPDSCQGFDQKQSIRNVGAELMSPPHLCSPNQTLRVIIPNQPPEVSSNPSSSCSWSSSTSSSSSSSSCCC